MAEAIFFAILCGISLLLLGREKNTENRDMLLIVTFLLSGAAFLSFCSRG